MNLDVEVLSQINPFLPRLLLIIVFYHRNKNPKTVYSADFLSFQKTVGDWTQPEWLDYMSLVVLSLLRVFAMVTKYSPS